MKIIRKIKLLLEFISDIKSEHQSIGFVPTMGSLHAGHFSLINRSIAENNFTICSIYVNPTQFNNEDDFVTYPRQNKNDIETLKALNCDLLFLPTDREIYPNNKHVLDCQFIDYMDILEGEKRPGHFLGVITIVQKLFSLITPNKVYFGEKDYQQLWIVKSFVQNSKLPIEIRSCPTIRDENGLALSSRNRNLKLKEKKHATQLFQALNYFKKEIARIQKDPKIAKTYNLASAKKNIIKKIINDPLIKLDYFEVIENENFRFAIQIECQKSYRILIAAYVGKIRLIDNMLIE